MVILQETTEFTDGQGGNHIYIFKKKPEGRGAKAVAYLPRGTDRVIKFRNPIKLDLKGRTFQKVD